MATQRLRVRLLTGAAVPTLTLRADGDPLGAPELTDEPLAPAEDADSDPVDGVYDCVLVDEDLSGVLYATIKDGSVVVADGWFVLTVTDAAFWCQPHHPGQLVRATDAAGAALATAAAVAVLAVPGDAMTLTADYDAAKTAAQPGDEMDLVDAPNATAVAAIQDGLSTHSAADVWSHGTRTLTSGANIVLAKGTGVTGFNDLSAEQVNAEVDAALADYDAPTAAELDAALAALQSHGDSEWGTADVSGLLTVDAYQESLPANFAALGITPDGVVSAGRLLVGEGPPEDGGEFVSEIGAASWGAGYGVGYINDEVDIAVGGTIEPDPAYVNGYRIRRISDVESGTAFSIVIQWNAGGGEHDPDELWQTVRIQGGEVDVTLNAADADYFAHAYNGIYSTWAFNSPVGLIHGTNYTVTFTSGVPTGRDDDTYLDALTGDFYGPRDGSWGESVGSLASLLPANFTALGINSSGHIERVVLVDTTTTNSDMRGTDDANTTVPPSAAAVALQVRTELTTELARIDETISSRLAESGYTAPPTATQNADALLDRAGAIDGKTLRESQRIMAAMLAGVVSGAGTDTEVFTGLDGTTTRATVTVDEQGNRTAVVYG